jgi:hypothetical protein
MTEWIVDSSMYFLVTNRSDPNVKWRIALDNSAEDATCANSK